MKPPQTGWSRFIAENPAQDTVRLSDEQWQALLQTLNAAQADTEAAHQERRAHDRQRYECRIRCAIRTAQPGSREAQTYVVYTRNISRGGVGLIHGMFLHAGTRLLVLLRTRQDTGIAIEGVVRWCRHIQGRLHEVGVQFDEPIDVNLFIDDNQMQSTG